MTTVLFDSELLSPPVEGPNSVIDGVGLIYSPQDAGSKKFNPLKAAKSQASSHAVPSASSDNALVLSDDMNDCFDVRPGRPLTEAEEPLPLLAGKPEDASETKAEKDTADVAEMEFVVGAAEPRYSWLSTGSTSTPRSANLLDFRNVFCGRDKEILELEAIFRRTASGRGTNKHPPLVLIKGSSGTGKSTLVSKLKEHLRLVEEEFFWIYGKFEEGQERQGMDSSSPEVNESDDSKAVDNLTPFTALVDAFSVFCQELAEEEPTTLEEVKGDIIEAVGQDGALLTFMIPSLSRIIGVQRKSLRESQKTELFQFHFVFKSFIQALASEFRCLVLVLDDMNRADDASLDLLHSLLTSHLKHVMFIGTYRSNEVNDGHRLNRWIARLREAQAPQEKPKDLISAHNGFAGNNTVTFLHLLDMDLETTNSFISKVLSMPADETRSLAHIIYTKTKGNAFFVSQYVLFLYKNQFLCFDSTKECWEWDESGIRKEAAVTTTLMDFMTDKLLQSEVAPKILPVAALLGAKFSQETLSLVLAGLAKVEALKEMILVSGSNVLELLKVCEGEGFIERCGNKTYCFIHDKMQEGALALHPTITMQRMRYEAGTVLFRQLSKTELEEKLFLVVNLLNHGHLRNDCVTHSEAAMLNLRAAEKAKRLAAFSSSATYVKNAMNFFPMHRNDKEHRALFLELCSLGAEVEAVIGGTHMMEKYCEMAINSAEDYTVFEQLRVLNVLIDSIANMGGQTEAALKLCMDILEQLGCSLPKTTLGQGVRAFTSLLTSKAAMDMPELKNVEDIELMTNVAKVEAMKLLDRMVTYSYLEANSLVFTICIVKMVRWTVRYGLCEKSPAAFGLLGLYFMHFIGDYKRGISYAKLAVAMMQRLQAITSRDESENFTLSQSEARTIFIVYAFSWYWVHPLQEYKDELSAGYLAGMKLGDTESACWNSCHDIAIKLAMGQPLRTLNELCQKTVSETMALKRGEAEVYVRIFWQFILNLIGGSSADGRTELSGRAMQEEYYLSKEGQWAGKLVPLYYRNTKIALCAYFGEYEKGANFAVEQGDIFLTSCPGAPWGLRDPLYRGICLYAAASIPKKRLYWRHAQKAHSTLRSWVKKGNPNALHQLKLLDAEHDAALGKRENANKLFELACDSAEGILPASALANLRFAEFLLSSSSEVDKEQFSSRLDKAVDLYKQWGAKAVVVTLLKKYRKDDH